MSTGFYELAPPVTSFRLSDNGGHLRVIVFIEGKQAGELVFDSIKEVGITQAHPFKRFLGRFIGEEVAVRTGAAYGTVTTVYRDIKTLQVTSDFGELHEVYDAGTKINNTPINQQLVENERKL